MLEQVNSKATRRLLETARTLLKEALTDGCWEGCLSSSALSTATAVVALSRVDRTAHAELIKHGLDWLAEHRNTDGGWGDTVLSHSNISTTLLCWAAFSEADGNDAVHREAVENAEDWLRNVAGGLEPEQLAETVAKRYGNDRTFSAPILTMCAITGRLGPARHAWRNVMQLPFELAACPHRWFKWLRLPVVSYALPALIAIGQARHHHLPTRNPVTRTLRAITRRKTLRKLADIQPASGGFLEAAPLTSFVVMSLAATGKAQHPVATRGIEFLTRTVRDDGSWAIDVNLATWLTTLSVNALDIEKDLTPRQRDAIVEWLLGQQHLEEHPYTGAAPGGWAWTDLPGGVPDADDTAGALLALHKLGPDNHRVRAASKTAVEWLLGLQNSDGGFPTFCRGWGLLQFDRSAADLTAHALAAIAQWRENMPVPLMSRIDKALRRGIAFLSESQQADGSWQPLWFGNQFMNDDANPTYGTARVLTALARLAKLRIDLPEGMAAAGAEWLLSAQTTVGGWGGGPSTPPSIEETALALGALIQVHEAGLARPCAGHIRTAAVDASGWLAEQTDTGEDFPAAPIGFYFAKLWYFERLYPIIFSVDALRRICTNGSAGNNRKKGERNGRNEQT